MADRETAAADAQDQPIWVQDLIEWLEKIQQQNLTSDEWVAQVKEVLAELPGQGLPEEFWQMARESAKTTETVQEKVGVDLPPLSDEDRTRIQKEMDAAQGIQDELARSYALAAVAVQLPASEPQLLQQALEAAQGVQDEYYRIQALAAIAAQLPASEPQLLQQALETVRGFQDEYFRSDALAAVAAQLPASERQSVLQQAMEAAKKIKNPSFRSREVAAIAAQLSASEPQLLQQPLEAAQGIGNESNRSKAIAEVATQLPASEQERVISIALDIEGKNHRIKALTNLAFQATETLILHCPPISLSTALEIVPEGKTSADKARLLSALAPRLSPGLFPRALQLIQTKITDPAYQTESLGNLAPYLPSDSLSEALNLVKNHIAGFSYPTIAGFSSPTTALCHLISRLTLPQLEEALAIADERGLSARPALLTQILHRAATRLTTPNPLQTKSDDSTQREELSQRILDLTQQHLITEKSITTVLTALAPSLNDSHLPQILETILPSLESEFYRAQVLAALATSPHLTPEQLRPIRQQAEALQQDRPRATALSALIASYPELHQTVVELRQKSANPFYKVDLALILATRPNPQKLDSDDRSKDQSYALRAIRELTTDGYKANCLIQLASHLLPNQILEAQSIAQDIQDCYDRARSLLALATHFPEIRAEAERQIDQVKKKNPEKGEPKDKYLILGIELLSQFATTVPEQIPALLQVIENSAAWWCRKLLNSLLVKSSDHFCELVGTREVRLSDLVQLQVT